MRATGGFAFTLVFPLTSEQQDPRAASLQRASNAPAPCPDSLLDLDSMRVIEYHSRIFSDTEDRAPGTPTTATPTTRRHHMKLTVYGATGRIGEQLVRQALDTGHNVTAVVRDPTRLNLHHPALQIITVPGLTDPQVLPPTLEGSHAAISAVGPRGRNDGPVASTATHAILHAMHTNGVHRLLAVSAVPVGPAVPTGESLLNRRIILPLISTFAREVYADLATMEDEIAHSTTDWTVVRPPKLNNKPLTGRYRTSVGANVPRGYSISRADVAHAMLQMLNDPATFRQAVGIAY